MVYDAEARITVSRMMQHAYFQDEGWAARYEVELARLINGGTVENKPTAKVATAQAKMAAAPTKPTISTNAQSRHVEIKKDYVTGTNSEPHSPTKAGVAQPKVRQTPSQWIASHYGNAQPNATSPTVASNPASNHQKVESITKKAQMFPKIGHLKASFSHH